MTLNYIDVAHGNHSVEIRVFIITLFATPDITSAERVTLSRLSGYHHSGLKIWKREMG